MITSNTTITMSFHIYYGYSNSSFSYTMLYTYQALIYLRFNAVHPINQSPKKLSSPQMGWHRLTWAPVPCAAPPPLSSSVALQPLASPFPQTPFEVGPLSPGEFSPPPASARDYPPPQGHHATRVRKGEEHTDFYHILSV